MSKIHNKSKFIISQNLSQIMKRFLCSYTIVSSTSICYVTLYKMKKKYVKISFAILSSLSTGLSESDNDLTSTNRLRKILKMKKKKELKGSSLKRLSEENDLRKREFHWLLK